MGEDGNTETPTGVVGSMTTGREFFKAPGVPMSYEFIARVTADLEMILDHGTWDSDEAYTFTYEGVELMVRVDSRTIPYLYYDYEPTPGYTPIYLGAFP